MNSNKVIIFCQAPADVPYVLELYEQLKGKNAVSIFVINVEGIFRFLSDLKLNLEQLTFIPYHVINLKKISLLYAERKRINFLWKTHFSNIQSGNVYFFSKFEDWLTAAFIHRFAENKKNQINYVDHYDDSAKLFPIQNKITFKRKSYLLILKYLTKVDFKAKIKEKLPEFPVNKYAILKIKVELDRQLFLKYAYKIDIKDKKISYLLFFVSPCEDTIFNPNYYNDTLIELINILKSIGFKIIVKGHPRIGMPVKVREIADFEIPSYVPGEFIDTSNLKICIGINTSAICYFAKNKILPTYSVINIFHSADKEMIKIITQYLQQQSNNKMLFLNTLEELKKIASAHL